MFPFRLFRLYLFDLRCSPSVAAYLCMRSVLYLLAPLVSISVNTHRRRRTTKKPERCARYQRDEEQAYPDEEQEQSGRPNKVPLSGVHQAAREVTLSSGPAENPATTPHVCDTKRKNIRDSCATIM